ncbi:hypothetical protein RI054_10g53470 [Pseudoscourfieldia marina]
MVEMGQIQMRCRCLCWNAHHANMAEFACVGWPDKGDMLANVAPPGFEKRGWVHSEWGQDFAATKAFTASSSNRSR